MDKNAIGERLRALAADSSQRRSQAARLRDVVGDVEIALAAGVPRAVVLDELRKFGLVMTLSTFETTLKRIRQKRKNVSTNPPFPASPVDQPAQRSNELPDAVKSAAKNAGTGSHDPAELDKIISQKPDLAALAKFAKGKKK